MKEDHRYDDIIHLPHHVSASHPQMPLADRAAQFSPFAALTGHGALLQETGRLTEEWAEPEEDQKALLDLKLQQIRRVLSGRMGAAHCRRLPSPTSSRMRESTAAHISP